MATWNETGLVIEELKVGDPGYDAMMRLLRDSNIQLSPKEDEASPRKEVRGLDPYNSAVSIYKSDPWKGGFGR